MAITKLFRVNSKNKDVRDLRDRLSMLEDKITELERKLIMSEAAIREQIVRIKEGVASVGARIIALLEAGQSPDVTPEESAQIAEELKAEADKLIALGSGAEVPPVDPGGV